MSLYYLLLGISPETLQPVIRQTLSQANAEMAAKYKTDIRETERQYLQWYEDSLLRFIGWNEIF